MKEDRWLPPDYTLGDGNHIRSLYVRGTKWQLYTTAEDGYALAVPDELYDHWLSLEWVEAGLFETAETDGKTVRVLSSRAGSQIASMAYGPYPHQRGQALSFVKALRRSLDRMGRIDLDDAIYVERFSLILSTAREGPGRLSVNQAAGRYLTGGLDVPLSSVSLVLRYAPYLTESDIDQFIDRLRLSRDEGTAGVLSEGAAEAAVRPGPGERRPRREGVFSLPGRPGLERFFREEIIEIVDREEDYRRMGVGFPGGTVLYGPPGCGKTYAVKQLTDFLGWPVYYIDSGSIGSKYVHETSRKIGEIFDQAAENAPSVIVIDELEAFLSSRESSLGSREIHLEEVAEFLRKIPQAQEKRVLVFGMTNLVEAVDKAILRRGRIDHMIEVGMPSEEEIRALLESLTANIPKEDDLPVEQISRELKGRPISDISFLVRDAARRTVRSGKDRIDTEAMLEALKALPPKDRKERRIGFGMN